MALKNEIRSLKVFHNEKLEILNNRISDIELSFTKLRLDLKAAGILHDKEYISPVITDIIPEKTKSEAIKKSEEINPFG